MNKLIKLSSFLFMFMAHAVVAEPIAVIVNSANNQTVNQSEVRSIYGDKMIAWANGDKIAVYNLPLEDAGADTFARKILGMSARDAATDEGNRAMKNTSRNPQQTKRAILVASIVSKTPNAIGYIPKEIAEGKSGIRVLFTLD